MIQPGDKIFNARTGQSMTFLKTGADTGGQLLQMDCISPPGGIKEPEHIHPKQESRARMISGSCTFLVDGKERIVQAGEEIIIPANVRHYFYNSGKEDAHYIQEFRPAGTIADFFDTFFALSREGKLNAKGIPNFFHASLIMLKHKDDIRVITPPWPIQLLSYWVCAPIGLMMGYKAKAK